MFDQKTQHFIDPLKLVQSFVGPCNNQWMECVTLTQLYLYFVINIFFLFSKIPISARQKKSAFTFFIEKNVACISNKLTCYRL